MKGLLRSLVIFHAASQALAIDVPGHAYAPDGGAVAGTRIAAYAVERVLLASEIRADSC